MPVRPLSSSVVRWPDAQTVARAVARWAERSVRQRPNVERIGYFGSYARGDWGVGSDLDLVVVVPTDEPFERRAASWDLADLPVPADLLVYTPEEWRSVSARGRFADVLQREAVWVYVKG